MATVSWSVFLNDIMPEVPHGDVTFVKHQLKIITRDLCARSKLFVEELSPINAVTGQALYALPAPDADRDVAFAFEVDLDGKEVPPMNRRHVAPRRRGDVSQRAWVGLGTNIRILPAPEVDSTGGLVVQAVLMPSVGADGPDAALFNTPELRAALASGTLQRLFAMPRKPWSSGEQALYHGGIFEKGVGFAKRMSAAGSHVGVLRTRVHDA